MALKTARKPRIGLYPTGVIGKITALRPVSAGNDLPAAGHLMGLIEI
jgi:hypothetical protein